MGKYKRIEMSKTIDELKVAKTELEEFILEKIMALEKEFEIVIEDIKVYKLDVTDLGSFRAKKLWGRIGIEIELTI